MKKMILALSLLIVSPAMAKELPHCDEYDCYDYYARPVYAPQSPKAIVTAPAPVVTQTAQAANRYKDDCDMNDGYKYYKEPVFDYKVPAEELYRTKKAIGVVYEVDTYKVHFVPQVNKVKSEERVVYCTKDLANCM